MGASFFDPTQSMQERAPMGRSYKVAVACSSKSV
jgi:hypothetical protein